MLVSIDDFFTSDITKKTFGSNLDETVGVYLTRAMDVFDEIINSQRFVSSIANRTKEKDRELTLK